MANGPGIYRVAIEPDTRPVEDLCRIIAKHMTAMAVELAAARLSSPDTEPDWTAPFKMR